MKFSIIKVDYRTYKSGYKLLSFLPLIILAWLTFHIIKNKPDLLEEIPDSTVLLYIGLVLVCILIPLIVYARYYNRYVYTRVGQMDISQEGIEIATKKNTFKLEPSQIQNLILAYFSSAGGVYYPSVKNKINMFWIEFDSDKKHYVYDFKIDNIMQFREVIKIANNKTLYNITKIYNMFLCKDERSEFWEFYANKAQRYKTCANRYK